MVLVNVGIVALMSATAAATRVAFTSHERAAALRVALNRVEWLSAQSCATAAASGDTAASFVAGAVERWSAASESQTIRDVRDSVGYPDGDSTRWVAVHTRTIC